ncbi:hypothetical protein Tco_0390563 [Tanacetum coccineum]
MPTPYPGPDVGSNDANVDEDVDLARKNVFVADQKTLLGDEDIEFCQKNYVVSKQRLFLSDEDVEFAQTNYFSDAKCSECGDANMNNVSDTKMFVFDDDAKAVLDDVPDLKITVKEI